MKSVIEEAALQYAKKGFSIIPVENKIPIIKWKPFQETPMGEEDISRCFKGDKLTGVAIVCGEVSGNLEVLDVDCKHDQTGELADQIQALISEVLPNLDIPTVKTKNDGLHIYYRCQTISGNQKLASSTDGSVLIETRGEGGYVVAPPSPGYKIISGDLLSIPEITPLERQKLLTIAASFDEAPFHDSPDQPASLTTNTGLSPFEDYNKGGNVLSVLEAHGWVRRRTYKKQVHYKRPGETDNYSSANFHTGLRTWIVFSTSTAFQALKPYSPSDVYAELECGGDLSQAAKQLLQQGFGTSINYSRGDDMPSADLQTPLLPIDGFPTLIQEFITTCTEVYGTPRDYWAGSVITSTALAIGDKFVLKGGPYENCPILWLCNVGPSSSGKTFPMELVLYYFQKRDAIAIEEHSRKLRKYNETLRKKTSITGQGPRCFQYIVRDITPEAMVKVHDVNKRGLLIYRDELKGWIDDFNRYNKGGEQSNMLSSWSRVPMTYNRKGDDQILCIEKPWIAVAGGIQPELLTGLAKDDRAESGFLARMLFVYPDKTPKPKYSEKTLPDGFLKEYESFIGILAIMQTPVDFILSDDARKLHKDWYNENARMTDQTESGYLKGVYGKLDVYVLRLAIIIKGMWYAVEDDIAHEVSGAHMQAAIDQVEYFRKTAIKDHDVIFGKTALQKPDLKLIAKFLHYEREASVTDIAKAFGVERKQIYRYLKTNSVTADVYTSN